ncbi:hypothetical protein L6R50_02100 [Myxococcota bacterium]|nr:hypothetical protein [Myxococcota bacterium]
MSTNGPIGGARRWAAVVAGAAAALGALGCGSNKACEQYCSAWSDRLVECSLAVGEDWVVAGYIDAADHTSQCSADFAVYVSASKVELRNEIRNGCAAEIMNIHTTPCDDLIDHYDDLWDAANGGGDDDTAGDDDTGI